MAKTQLNVTLALLVQHQPSDMDRHAMDHALDPRDAVVRRVPPTVSIVSLPSDAAHAISAALGGHPTVEAVVCRKAYDIRGKAVYLRD